MFSFILILAALDNLFNLLLFLVGISFIVLVTGHYYISLIVCLQSPAVIWHPRSSSGIPGRHLWSPSFFIHMCPTVIPDTCRLCPPPAVLPSTLQSLPTPCRLLIPPYHPPHNPGGPPISPALCLNRAVTCVSLYLDRPSVGPGGPSLAQQSPR